MAFIERVEVENEGFLARAELRFTPGLNVLIGARGTGKTSVIELIRYALQAGAFTTDAATKGEQQAVAVLDGGAVTVTLREGNTSWSVTRTSEGASTTAFGAPPACTILAQNEVESLAVSPQGRLYLIDRFYGDAAETERRITEAASATRTATQEIANLLEEIERNDSATTELGPIEEELERARAFQQALLTNSSATKDDQAALLDSQSQMQALAQRENQLRFTASSLESAQGTTVDLRAQVKDLAESALLLDVDTVQELIASAALRLEQATNEMSAASTALREETTKASMFRAKLDEQSRALRRKLDSVQDGLSQASRQVQQLEERKGQFDALVLRRRDLLNRLDQLRERRSVALASLEKLRLARIHARQQVAKDLTEKLAPQIRVRVAAGKTLNSYTSALVSGLRGSGLHYNTLAPALAKAVSPVELVDWIERSAVDELVNAAGVSVERASTVLRSLRQSSAASIIAVDVEDEVTLELLDGPDYKPVEHLSIGQRCTVVLPILLALEGETLIVDQPEDHLDNAFIASTLIAAIRRREGRGQVIFSSHNANIPVLGDARNVIALESDGESAEVRAAGALDNSSIRDTIATLMEGGEEAFAARAAFYERKD